MKYINIISLIIISLIFSSCGNNELEKNQDAVYKSIKKIYTLNSDGSINYQYQHQLKYITHYSFNNLFGESFIVYNPEQQELKINKAETKMLDGKIVPSPENAFNKVLPHFADGVPAYNHFREMVVTHTALEPGCFVDFDYEVITSAGYLPFLSGNIILQEIVPVENLEIIVNISDNAKLNYKLVNIENQAIVSKKEGFTQYKWTFENMANLKNEVDESHVQSYLPRLIFSTVNLTDAVSKLYSKDDLELSDDIKTFVKKRVSGIKSEMNIINELQTIAGKELNDFHIPLEYSSYSIRPLNDVWNSNGGTNLEKSLLLNEIIKYNGFESRVIMALPTALYDKNIGCLKGFGHFYIQVNVDGEDIIISTDADQSNNLAFELKNAVILDLEGNSIHLSDIEYKLESLFMANGKFEINDSGDLSGKLNLNVHGVKNPYLNYLEDAENAKEIAESMFSEEEITDFKVLLFDNTKSEVEASIEEKEIWKNQGDYYFVKIPTSDYGLKGELLDFLLNERQTALKLSYPINESYNFNISIPKGFNFVAPIVNKVLTNEIGTVRVEIRFADDSIYLKKSIKINKVEISPAEYGSFKNLLDIWNKKTYNEIILKKVL
ncbi:MAG: DUF3857 domain-containing protein [Bacteroidales bacterium]|nr:DUF3857 domain-containing protein [Bacteroidales bacterium]